VALQHLRESRKKIVGGMFVLEGHTGPSAATVSRRRGEQLVTLSG